MISITEKYIKIDSKDNSLVIEKTDSRAEIVYYGKKLNNSDDYSFFSISPKDGNFASNDDNTNIRSIISGAGEGSNKECSVLVSGKNGIFSSRFSLTGAEIVDSFDSPLPTSRNKGETVKLVFSDDVLKITLNQYYTVFNDSPVIAVHSEIVNTSDDTVFVRKLMSCQLDFIGESAEMITFDGTWKQERSRRSTLITAGSFEISSRLGVSSAQHNPFFMAKINGDYIGFNLIYSGNHKEKVEVSPYRRIRILTGINDHALSYRLEPSEKFVSPEAIFTLAKDEKEITSIMHRFSLDHIISTNFAYKDRPVLINNWEGTYFDFTGEKIYEIAKTASKCGIEMLVLDDGWFGARNNDHAGLGDWIDNREKTGGLEILSERIHSLGMKFGLWVEPEMIQTDSDLYRNHPEYAMQIPSVEPIERRHQLCIDLCNDDARKYLTDTLIGLFKKVNVDYVKWDHNRSMSDVYSTYLDNQEEYFYRYYVAQSKMLSDITNALPDVLFESCASGGSRYDLGMQYFMPQNWASDNTNAYDRLFIQEGTLAGYPQSSMGAHVAASRSIPLVSLESRFNVAAIGAFGYELDITKMSKEELAIVKKQVAYFKKHRRLFQYGNYIRLGSPLGESETGGWMLVSDNKNEAIAVIIDKSDLKSNLTRPFFKFEGLKDDTLYKVTMRNQDNVNKDFEFTAYGDALCNGTLDFGYLFRNEKDAGKYSARFASRMFYIKKIK